MRHARNRRRHRGQSTARPGTNGPNRTRLPRTFFLVLAGLLAWAPFLSAQSVVPALLSSAPPVVIPFTLLDEKVCVPVRVGLSRTLNVILDTGMGYKGLLLLKRDLTELLPGTQTYESSITGAGDGLPTPVVFTVGAEIVVGELTLEHQPVAVTQTDLLRYDETDGVIGYSLLGQHVVEIDYDAGLITLHDPDTFEPGPEWDVVPLTFDAHNWPLVSIAVAIDDGEPVQLEASIDLGSPHAIELTPADDAFNLVPARTDPTYVGRGLSGDIYGLRGRLTSVRIGSHELRDVAVVIVESDVRSTTEGAEAIVASGLLRRFNLILDYPHQRLLIRANASIDEPFR
ncbi:MAG: aspartyl protease family protein [Acidobacteria bacterium]|nr:aspartyl protease family protein [Acidobacteriota bacterium]